MSETRQLRLEIGLLDGADDAELDAETVQLRSELLELAVDDVQQPSGGPAPAGARAVDPTLLATLLVTAGKSAAGALAGALTSWLSRRRGRTLKVELGGDSLELSDVSREEQRQVLQAFLERHMRDEGLVCPRQRAARSSSRRATIRTQT